MDVFYNIHLLGINGRLMFSKGKWGKMRGVCFGKYQGREWSKVIDGGNKTT